MMAVQIEAGKFYRGSDGRKIGPMRIWGFGNEEHPFDAGGNDIWRADGTTRWSDQPVLVAEWVDPTADNGELPQKWAKGTINVGDMIPQSLDMTAAVQRVLDQGTPDGKQLMFDQSRAWEPGLTDLAPDELVVSTFGPLHDLPSLTNCETPVSPKANDCLKLPTVGMKATEIAGKAANLVGGDRDRQHGAKHDNFSRIAAVWNAWLRIRREPSADLDAHDVGVMMVLMKMARTQSGSLNIDDYIDACGYAACAGEVAQIS